VLKIYLITKRLAQIKIALVLINEFVLDIIIPILINLFFRKSPEKELMD